MSSEPDCELSAPKRRKDRQVQLFLEEKQNVASSRKLQKLFRMDSKGGPTVGYVASDKPRPVKPSWRTVGEMETELNNVSSQKRVRRMFRVDKRGIPLSTSPDLDECFVRQCKIDPDYHRKSMQKMEQERANIHQLRCQHRCRMYRHPSAAWRVSQTLTGHFGPPPFFAHGDASFCTNNPSPFS